MAYVKVIIKPLFHRKVNLKNQRKMTVKLMPKPIKSIFFLRLTILMQMNFMKQKKTLMQIATVKTKKCL